MSSYRYVVVASEADPVASAVAPLLGVGESTGFAIEGAGLRRIAEGVLLLRRPGLHLRDDHLDQRFPTELREARLPLVFPSVHRSEKGVRCFTCHSIGNLGDDAEAGGEPRRLVPAAARLVTDTLRRLSESGASVGLPATFEATHHGPSLDAPALFAEISTHEGEPPDASAVRALARVLVELSEDPRDHIAVGIGGGHYAPHFTKLALDRHWAFGHIVSRHVLLTDAPGSALAALRGTGGAEGFLFHRAADAEGFAPIGARLSERSAPRRAAEPP